MSKSFLSFSNLQICVACVREEMLAQNEYDALGQLIQKNVGNDAAKPLQEVKYKYNVRGWLKQINDPTNLGNSLFAFGLNYTSPSCDGTPLYNGNISQTHWRTANTDSDLKSYTYTYDALNRLTDGVDNTGDYKVSGISYDKNGNILTLKRQGALNEEATVFGVMDDLNYAYDGRSSTLANDDIGGNQLLKIDFYLIWKINADLFKECLYLFRIETNSVWNQATF